MGKKDARVDVYIAKAGDFAKPILRKLRALVHRGCPEAEETVKWGMPAFEYRGPLCTMAAFSRHAAFGFWKSKLLRDTNNALRARSSQGGEAMGNFGRLTSVNDLPADGVMIGLIKQAKKLNDEGRKLPPRAKHPKKPLRVPPDLKSALARNARARMTWEDFSYSHKKEYLEWITEAKTSATRSSRLAKAIDWMADGKQRNWKYQKG